MSELDAIRDALSDIEARLADLAYERLSAAAAGDPGAESQERRIQQARRAVARALAALGAEPEL